MRRCLGEGGNILGESRPLCTPRARFGTWKSLGCWEFGVLVHYLGIILVLETPWHTLDAIKHI